MAFYCDTCDKTISASLVHHYAKGVRAYHDYSVDTPEERSITHHPCVEIPDAEVA